MPDNILDEAIETLNKQIAEKRALYFKHCEAADAAKAGLQLLMHERDEHHKELVLHRLSMLRVQMDAMRQMK